MKESEYMENRNIASLEDAEIQFENAKKFFEKIKEYLKIRISE
jgi:hypothetical protein